MDLPTVTRIATPAARADIPVGAMPLAGGTWVFSEPQLGVTELVDLLALGWRPITVRESGIELAATATLAAVAAHPFPASWPGAALFDAGARALLASFKVLDAATVGGNLALSYPAGAMIAVAVALDATVQIWRADGSDEDVAARDFVTGSQTNVLRPGDLIRRITYPAAALECPVAHRKLAPSSRGRSAAFLIGRTLPDGTGMLTVTASTVRPVVLTGLTDWGTVGAAIDPDLFVDDVHGAADWRRHVTGVLAGRIADELGWGGA
ncbi:FAD binding domain-containing protein [Tsukamurella soli]|uniref:FAD binding domain-containing protein n=1 Tax=Tsukamurella soli TaxID=644556 RepID=A0ABP8JVS3_9ACTN